MSENEQEIELSAKQSRGLAALLSEPTATAAAKKAGVSIATLMRWLNEPAFSAAYREARGRLIEDTMRALQAAGVDAVQCLRGVIADSDAPVTAKIAAARSIIEFGLKARDAIDVEERLKALEDRFLKGETNGDSATFRRA